MEDVVRLMISVVPIVYAALSGTHTLSHTLFGLGNAARRADGMLSELIPRVLAEKRMSLKFIGRNYKSNNSNNWEKNNSSAAADCQTECQTARQPARHSQCEMHFSFNLRVAGFYVVPRLAVKSIDRRGRLS